MWHLMALAVSAFVLLQAKLLSSGLLPWEALAMIAEKCKLFFCAGCLRIQQEGQLQHVHEHGLAKRHEMPSLLPATDPAASYR